MQAILDEIKTSIDKLAPKINAPRHFLPAFGQPTGEDHPYIKVNEYGQLYYVIVENGEELEYPTPNINDLLYRVFRTIAFSMASEFVANNAVEKEYEKLINEQKNKK